MKSRVLHTSKDIGHADEYDDAFFVDDSSGRVAVADGVSSALFSGVWARIVTRTLVESGVDATDPEAFRGWLASARAAWLAEVDLPRLSFFQQEKLRRVGGAFCTLLFVQVESADSGETTASRYRAWALGSSSAIGDTCLLHWRDGALIDSFPLTQPAEFDADPAALCSSPSRRDQDIELRMFESGILPGDVLLLATDAVSKWILSTVEAEERFDVESLWIIPLEQWESQIESLRANRALKRDDSTIVLLSLGDLTSAPNVGTEDELTTVHTAMSFGEADAPDMEPVPLVLANDREPVEQPSESTPDSDAVEDSPEATVNTAPPFDRSKKKVADIENESPTPCAPYPETTNSEPV